MGGSCCRRLSRCRCLTPRRGSVSSRRSPNPTCGFPALGSPVGSCASHTSILPIRPAVARKTDRECMLGDGTTPAYRTVSFRTCHQACLRLDGTGPFDGCGPSSGSGPSLMHAMPSGIPGQIRGDRHCHSQDPAPFQHPSVKGGEKPDQRAEQNTATATVGVRWSEGVGIRLEAAGAGNAGRA